MKMISCYVENFGKLNKFTYDFEDGLNIKEEKNGWGKSTFAAFIKAMFYGLEYRRGKILTDRKLYSPWNENKFGGYIIFQKDGTEYKIERFFGKTEKSDTLTVYNMSRNTVTDELGDNPGETIWKVDRDSYEKTAFITLDDSSLLNDIISSKLGNIEDQEADIEASTQAVELLDKEITIIKAKRGKGGLIGNKENVLSKLKNELRQYRNSLLTLSETEKWIDEKEHELKNVTEKINKIEEKQSKLVLYDRKIQYREISDALSNKERNYNNKKRFFKNQILSEEELNNIKNEVSKYISNKEQGIKIKLTYIKENELQELKAKFDKDTPSLIEIQKYNRKINELSNKETEIKKYITSDKNKERFVELEKKYKDIDSNTIDGYLDDLNQVAELIQEENKFKNKIERLKQENIINQNTKSKLSTGFLIGLAIIALGIILTPMIFIVGIIIGLAGFVVLVKSFTDTSKDKKGNISTNINAEVEELNKSLKQTEDKRRSLEDGYLSFIGSINENPSNVASLLADVKVDIVEYDRLKGDIEHNVLGKEKIDNDILNLKSEIRLYLNKYYGSVEESDYNKMLSDLRNDLNSYQNLLKAEKLYNQSVEEADSLEKDVNEKLRYYYDDFSSGMNVIVQDLTNKYYDFERSRDKFKEAKKNKDNFELQNNILILDELDMEDIDDKEAAENLKESKNNLNKASNNFIKEIERYKKDIDNLIQEVDKIEDIESEILKTEEEIEDLNKQHSLLTLTKECMIDAKESLAEKYIGDMSSSFRRHLNKLNNGKTKKYHIDINLSVKVEHGGKLYDKDQLSSGMKDLVQLCLRMALVESVYKDVDNPILILDDPFINLDDDRLKSSMELLKELSSEYQIIYFICHSSRNIK